MKRSMPNRYPVATGLVAAITCIAGALASPETGNPDDFNPKDLDNLEFFVESVKGLALAKNDSEDAYNNTRENTPLDKIWSDRKRFPHGTVRWWLDQSPYVRSKEKRQRPNWVFKTGRDIGQDDHDRPGYIPEGCNGKPCVRGGLIGTPKGKHHNKQPCYFEFQLESRDFKFDGPFGVFLLVRPIEQERKFCYFGVYHRTVFIQHVKNNSLIWKNGGAMHPLTGPQAVRTGAWQLLELHRDAQNRLACFVNGKNVTRGNPSDSAAFEFLMLFNNNKGQNDKIEPFAGDMASLIVYRDVLTNDERQKVRAYLNGIYGFMGRRRR